MDFQQLNYFFSVANTGNFTKSSELLYTSQPTISRQIRMLENELGYSIFDRNSKPLQLTQAGKILYDGLKEAMSKMDYTLESAKIASEGKTGSLSIAFQAGYYTEYMLFPILNEFRKNWPNVQIRCNKLVSLELLNGLKNNSIDLCIGREFSHWIAAGFTIIKLQKVNTLIVMSVNHRLATTTTLKHDDLCGETFYLTAPNGYQIMEIFKNYFCLTDVKQVEVSTSEIAYFKVLAENGLTISNPDDPSWVNNPYYHSIPIHSFCDDSYVCVTNPDNINPSIDLFLGLMNQRWHSLIPS